MSFSNNWFNDSELKKNINKYLKPDQENHILEIGVFEGAGSCFFSNNYLDAEGSTLTCVDPFDVSDTTSPVYCDIKTKFINNIGKSKHWQKSRLCNIRSANFFKKNIQKFNFIYIDGSHIVENIKHDFSESIKCCKYNGIIWMDDYLGGNNHDIKNCIDEMYNNYKDNLQIIHIGYQIAFRMLN